MDLPDLTNLGPIAPGSILVLRGFIPDTYEDPTTLIDQLVADVTTTREIGPNGKVRYFPSQAFLDNHAADLAAMPPLTVTDPKDHPA